MEKIESFNKKVIELEKGLESNHPNFDEMDLYQLKKEMLLYKLDNPNDTKIDTLLSLMDNLDTAFDKAWCALTALLLPIALYLAATVIKGAGGRDLIALLQRTALFQLLFALVYAAGFALSA